MTRSCRTKRAPISNLDEAHRLVGHFQVLHDGVQHDVAFEQNRMRFFQDTQYVVVPSLRLSCRSLGSIMHISPISGVGFFGRPVVLGPKSVEMVQH